MVVDIFHQLIGHNSIMAQKLAEIGHDPNALIDSVEPGVPPMGEPLNPGETVDPAIAGAPSVPGAGAEIKMMDVISSNLKQVGYDEGTKTLYIRFTSGTSLWEYAAVPAEVYQDMLAAKSLGAFFASNIKGKYESTEHKSAAA